MVLMVWVCFLSGWRGTYSEAIVSRTTFLMKSGALPLCLQVILAFKQLAMKP